jgi:aryl-alcohol dehydrogenase-like predicted oxidoreductase
MRTRTIGSLTVSVVGIGCNNFGWKIFAHPLDEAATTRVVHAALDAGITFFDTAEAYGDSEELLGRALRDRREQAVVATKFGRAGAADVRRSIETSLRRLNTDRIDLLQLHRPNPDVPIAETLGVLDDAVKAGQVKEIGCSNFTPAQLREADVAAGRGARFVSVQNELNLLKRDASADVLPACAELGLAFLPFFPLASGLLTGKYRKGRDLPSATRLSSGPMAARVTADALDRVEALAAFSEARGRSLLDLAFAWLLAWPQVASVIAGVTSVEQVHANAAAAAWALSAADREALETVLA